jgi:hypothetical protein
MDVNCDLAISLLTAIVSATMLFAAQHSLHADLVTRD